MGLDISYYTNARAIPDAQIDEDGECVIDKTVVAYVNPSFAERADNIQDRAVYAYSEAESFRAGSYGGYNVWRDDLARIAGYPSARAVCEGAARDGDPFFALINFSDCEGVIGPETSTKLAKDFAEHQAKVDALRDTYFQQKYAAWRQAFEAVAGNGFVDFH